MGIFDRSSKRRLETSVHNLSHSYDGDFYPGYIYPVLCTKVVPGDTFQIASSPFLRSQPFVAPLLTNVYCDIRYFYCRNLLLWDEFDQYITNSHKFGKGDFNINDPAPVHPHFTFNTVAISADPTQFVDYLYGIKKQSGADGYVQELDALPARMYNLIFNEYYYNQYYDKTAAYNVSSGQDDIEDYMLRVACYKKDYFTSALPSAQRGEPVTMSARVLADRAGNGLIKAVEPQIQEQGFEVLSADYTVPSTDPLHGALAIDDGSEYGYYDPNGTLGVSIDINDLRKASAIQRFLELSAVNGNRYAELMLAHFGVRIADRSASRPQYLGGGSQIINFSAVEQNSQTDETPQGTLAGKGTMRGLMGMNKPFFFTEHGWLMALMVIRPEAVYCGGVNRQFWVGKDRYETYYWPGLQNIGMQAIKRKELSLQAKGDDNENPNSLNDADIGYTDRYLEYKNIPNSVHGNLAGGSMSQWVAIRDFTASPEVVIGNAVVDVPIDAFDNNAAVSDYPPFVGGVYHHIIARRPMQYHAKYGGVV